MALYCRFTRVVLVAAFMPLIVGSAVFAADSSPCPNGGVVRFGVEPFDDPSRLAPIYDQIAKLIGDQLGCKVTVTISGP